MNLKYELRTSKPFEEAVELLKQRLNENNFGVLWELDFKEKFKEKGLEFNANFKILEVCNPKQAKEVLNKNIEAGYFLPCKLVVYEKDDSALIGMMSPTELVKLLGDKSLLDIAESVETTLKKVIDLTI